MKMRNSRSKKISTFSKYLIAFAVIAVTGEIALWMSRVKSHQTHLSHLTEPQLSKKLSTSQPPSSSEDQVRLVSSQKLDSNSLAEEGSETQIKLQVLKEIIQSKNDNDPRLDTEFNQLSPTTKIAMQEHYRQLPLEQRNERGTIIFLLSRTMSSPADYEFLSEVMKEPPCLSLADCTSRSEGSDPSHEMGFELTTQYPQIVALKGIESILLQNPHSPEALSVLKVAMNSESGLIAKTALSLFRRIKDKS